VVNVEPHLGFIAISIISGKTEPKRYLSSLGIWDGIWLDIQLPITYVTGTISHICIIRLDWSKQINVSRERCTCTALVKKAFLLGQACWLTPVIPDTSEV
jgi:hypothetical protein